MAWCWAIGLPNVSRSLRVRDGGLERGSGDAHRPRRDVDAADLERREDVVLAPAEALVTTEHAVGVDAVPVVGHLHGLDALVARACRCCG